MGTECVQPSLRESCDANLGIPSASSSIIPLTLEKASDDDVICLGSSNASDSVRMQNDNLGSVVPKEKSRKSLRNRPCINYGQFDNSSDEETVPELVYHDIPPRSSLRKGVLRGCPDCATCQKVLARWHPQDACRPSLDEAPVFYPNEEEFKDTLKYIESIHAKAESYGICKIVPPPSWRPPCPLKEKVTWENSKFNTRVQRVDLLQNRKSVRQMCRGRGKKRRISKPGLENGNNNGHILKVDEHHHHSIGDNFGFEPGPSFSLDSFQKYADDFKRQYFSKRSITESMGHIHSQEQREPSVEDIEGEYWRVVEKPTEEIEVLYGADLETGDFSSGFPRVATSTSDSLENEYLKSGWNLNRFPRLPGSVLSFEEEDISGVLVPWLYVGMCFSSFCWHVEDHHFYSLNYMHLGAPKMWYGVPGKDAFQLEAAMKKHLPDLFEEQPDLLHNLVTQFSPSILKSEGVPVYRCIQNPGEFVLTFPRAYHSGFNCGFNCAEAVNVAPVDWLPHGQNAVELYRDQGRKISVSHDKLLLGAAREAVKAQWDILFLKKTTPYSMLWKNICGPDKVLVRSLKARIEMEHVRREPFSTSQSRKMEADFNPNSDKECFICHYDLYLSAAGCSCSPDKLACLNHAKQICSCDWSMKFLLYRYQIAELNVLVDALGGKLSAVHKWGISDLGLTLRKYVTKQKTQEKASAGETSPERRKEKPKESLPSCNKQQTGLHQITPSKKESEMTHETSLEKEKDCPVSQTKEESSVSHAMTCPSFRKEAPHGTPVKGARQEQNQMGQPITKVEDTPVNFDKGTTLLSDKVRNSMCLDGKECKEPSCTGTDGKKEEFIKKHPEAPVRTTGYADKTTPDHKDRVSDVSSSAATSKTESELFPPVDGTSLLPASLPIKQGTAEKATPYHKDRVSNVSTSAVTSKTESGLFPPVDGTNLLPASLPKVKEERHGEILRENVYSPFGTSFYLKEESHDLSNTRNVTNPSVQFPASNQMGHFDNFNHEKLHGANPYNCVNPMDVSKGGNLWPNPMDRRNDGRWPIPGKQYCPPTDSERCNFQRGSGPRIAKVVRRINCIVEALEFGIVLPGSLWCSSQAIFPKGYRSRVRYLSILDPSQTCNYVSEILDGGSHGPLFMVQVEQQPSEVFLHLSAHKCWDLVRERVNHEIRRLQSLGRLGIPTLQLPGSVDGLEMFGLTSPAIVKEIEAIDYNRVSFEYWRSRPQMNNPVGFSRDPRLRLEEAGIPNKVLPSSSDTILQGLLRKANPEELQILRRLLTNDRFGINQGTSRLLN